MNPTSTPTHSRPRAVRRPRTLARRWLPVALFASATVVVALCFGILSVSPATVASASPAQTFPAMAAENATAPWRAAPVPQDRHCHAVNPFPRISLDPLTDAPLADAVSTDGASTGTRDGESGFARLCVQPPMPRPEPLGGAPRVDGLAVEVGPKVN